MLIGIKPKAFALQGAPRKRNAVDPVWNGVKRIA